MATTKKSKSKAVNQFYWLANHFEPRDWDYTRQHHIESIRYEPKHDPHNKLSYRLKSAFLWAFFPPSFMKQLHPRWQDRLRSRFTMPLHAIKRDPNTPDGILNGGNVVTFWEETGEYLQYLQYSVGSMLADFLMDEPEHPYAQLITKEMERINRRYARRIKAGDIE